MSDVMLHGVLEMPPELWSGDRMDVLQRHGRYKQASERIRQDAETIRALSERLARVEADAERYRLLRHFLSPRITSNILVQPEVLKPQDGWSTEDWTDAIVDSAATAIRAGK